MILLALSFQNSGVLINGFVLCSRLSFLFEIQLFVANYGYKDSPLTDFWNFSLVSLHLLHSFGVSARFRVEVCCFS